MPAAKPSVKTAVNSPKTVPSAHSKTKSARARKSAFVKAKSSQKRVVSRSRSTSTRIRNFRCKQTYHLFQRGNFKRVVFVNDEERAAYLHYFFSRAAKHYVRVHHFCLMPNHVHFVVEQTRRHGISRLMRDLQGLHTRKQNSRTGQIGNLWNQHYGCKHVSSDRYYRALMWYVSNNPVKTGSVTSASLYRWSGARALIEGGAWTMYIRTQKGTLQPVQIRLWMARFREQFSTTTWAAIQNEPLPSDLLPQIAEIELVLDGTARVLFANQERITRLNLQREATKLMTRQSSRPRKQQGKASKPDKSSKMNSASPPAKAARGA